jgi:galactokinase/CTP:molybdopterin cytidylyltransferase MocA
VHRMKLSELKRALAPLATDEDSVFDEWRARLFNLAQMFSETYGDGDVSLLRAPARINILGEHIDYVSYLPTASLTFGSREHDALMLYRKSAQPEVRGRSTSPAYGASSFALSETHVPEIAENAESEWLSFLNERSAPQPGWQNYIQGATEFARARFGQRVENGFDFIVDSTIPAGGGASSSSALVVLGGAAIRYVNGISFTPEELAHESSMAEWYIGTRGGSMDHTTICMAQESSAVLISYSSRQTRRVALPDKPFEWITFFTKPANKGHEIMIEYNERAAVSRLLIPAILKDWEVARLDLWNDAVESFRGGSLESLDTIEKLLRDLPETISIYDLQSDYPDAYSELQTSFPALSREHSRWPLHIRTRAMHHLGEVRRVAMAASALDAMSDEDSLEVMQTIGKLIDDSHESLRDLYDVSNDDIEQLIRIIRSHPAVLGTRLMGGGFGGNVLVLTTSEHSESLIKRVESEYYAPQRRDGFREGSILISTPGSGLDHLDLNDIYRSAVKHTNRLDSRSNLVSLLDGLAVDISAKDIWPVVVAAGRGTRAAGTGMKTSKPLALIGQKPAIVYVLDNIRNGLGQTEPPVIIVSPETENSIREQLKGRDVIFATQQQALGTGDAVLNAHHLMQDFTGMALVVWSTQPVIRPVTYERTTKLFRLFDECEMVVPTTFRERPYAPIHRNESGEVQAALETHLENAEPEEFGETNIGMFALKNQTMFDTLLELRRRYWNESKQCYERSGRELGFPNELINYLSSRKNGVLAFPIADWREEQGIKTVNDVATCEGYISELVFERRTTS